MIFEVYSINRMMYTVEAAYFKAGQDGVIFFDENDNGVAFVPCENLELVKNNPRETQRRLREGIEKVAFSSFRTTDT